MTLAEKLRFLADRIDDGKEFYVTTYGKGVCKSEWEYDDFFHNFYLSDLEYATLEPVPRWKFTEDEKAILRNLPYQYEWIARDKDRNELYAYTSEPIRATNQHWAYENGGMVNLNIFRSIFQSIKWSDEEPCEFRKYL